MKTQINKKTNNGIEPLKLRPLLCGSYGELEKLTGIHSPTWSKYFNGYRNLSQATAERIAGILETHVYAVFWAIEFRRKNKKITADFLAKGVVDG